MHTYTTAVVSGAGPTTTSKQLKEIPQQDKGAAVYDVPSENQAVYSEVTRAQDSPTSPGEYATFDNPLYETN